MAAYLTLAVLLTCFSVIAFLLLGRLDQEARMHDNPGDPSLRRWLREYLGLPELATAVQHLHEHLRRMEHTMATATEQLNTLTGKVDDLIADVRAALATIGQDTLSETAQAALDGLTAKIAAFDTEVGDADGSDVPVENPTDA